ncbi:RHOMBOID-like protein 2 [Phragmites australis]|uniref:RHOMBOID-like protein 2 n=1 Tax=Phragmites australis TaxID=29695 RepID=UPI002D76F6B0|nr:RHOMBOID-like protein 2 [Phragmites australis]
MPNADVEAGGPARAVATGIKPPPGPHNASGNGNGPYVPPFYYDHAAAHERHHRSWLVPLVVLANVAMFLVVMFYNDCPRSGGNCVGRGFLRRFSFQPLRENPLLGPSATTLNKYGALDWQKVVHGNQAWRLESCTWLHAGLIHLLANMISLIFIGVRLEQQFGFWKVGLVYLVSGFGGSVLSVLFIGKGVSVGASGALMGLLGAMLSELITNWTIYTNRFAAMMNLIIITAVNLALGILPHVDNFAHIGGFATGFFLGFVLLIQPQFRWLEQPLGSKSKSKYNAYQIILLVVALLLLIAGFAVGLIMVFRGENGNDHCSWCHYLSCVPTSSWKCDN